MVLNGRFSASPRIVGDGDAEFNGTIVVKDGEEFSLPCVAEGSPTPEVTWFKDGEALNPYATGTTCAHISYWGPYPDCPK